MKKDGLDIKKGTKVKFRHKNGSQWGVVTGFRLMFTGQTWISIENHGLIDPARIIQVAGTQLDMFEQPRSTPLRV